MRNLGDHPLPLRPPFLYPNVQSNHISDNAKVSNQPTNKDYKYYGKTIIVGDLMGKNIVTSIRVDEDVWKEAKKLTIDRGITLADLIDELIKKELKRVQTGK